MSFCILDMIDVNIYTVVFVYLTIKDILKLSTSSKILRIKCKEINGYVDQSIVVMELRILLATKIVSYLIMLD